MVTRRADGPPLGKLKRFLDRRPERRPGEVCELCGVPLPDEHPHLVDVHTRGLLCACRPCYLLFPPEVTTGRYRGIPDRYRHAGDLVISEADWEALQIPISMVFFFHNSSLGRTVAFYPSPAGATESLLPLDRWQRLAEDNPLFAELVPDVEAALIRRQGGTAEGFVLPIDACYELVGRIKRSWKGFHGGDEAWREIESFFRSLRQRCGVPDPDAAASGALRNE